VDRVSLSAFEKDLKGNLYKIWNRMSSGSYIPPAEHIEARVNRAKRETAKALCGLSCPMQSGRRRTLRQT
jgi:hypothetical protein